MNRGMFTSVVLALLVSTACQQPPALPSFSPAVGNSATCQGQSADVTLSVGQTAQLQVMCTNTGTTAWTRATATEASLATCCPIGANITCSTWGVTNGRYGTQTQTSVASGAIGTFQFNLTVPAGTTSGTHYCQAALVNAANQPIAAQGLTFTVKVP